MIDFCRDQSIVLIATAVIPDGNIPVKIQGLRSNNSEEFYLKFKLLGASTEFSIQFYSHFLGLTSDNCYLG